MVIYLISLFFDQFLRLSAVTSAFRGIQACVIYLILSAGIRMLKNLQKTGFNAVILTAVILTMVGCSAASVSFYILLSGAAGLAVWGIRRLRKGGDAK